MNYDIGKLKNILLAETGYLEKKKNCPIEELYKKIGSYVGSDNWTKYWNDCTNLGLTNYQGSYYCIAALFWGMIQAYGLSAAQKLCKQTFMINCQTTYELFKNGNQVYSLPKTGDIIVFWNGSRFYHAELVIDVKGDIFKTFGANTSANSSIRNGGGCYAPKSYSISAAQNSGHKFLRPNYGLQDSEGWVKDNTIWRYRLSNGAFVTNSWKYINGRWYMFDGAGTMCTGWIYSSNQWYYCCPEVGCMDTGWLQIHNRWYYMNADGSMHSGWLQDKDKWYYLESDGTMVTGWKKIGDIYYVFDNSGCMIANTWFLDSTGSWYYLSSTGAMKTSQWIQQKNNNWYYVKEDGQMAKSSWIKDIYKDIFYFVDKDGVYLPDKDTHVPDKYPLVI